MRSCLPGVQLLPMHHSTCHPSAPTPRSVLCLTSQLLAALVEPSLAPELAQCAISLSAEIAVGDRLGSRFVHVLLGHQQRHILLQLIISDVYDIGAVHARIEIHACLCWTDCASVSSALLALSNAFTSNLTSN